MTNDYYLAQGTQTKFTDGVYEHARKARDTVMNNLQIAVLPEPIISIHKTCKYISQLHYVSGFNVQPQTREEKKANRNLKDSISWQRDLDQVLEEGYYPSCSDIGLLFRGLMAAQGHPTAYVRTFHKDFLLDIRPREAEIMGHVFGRVYFNDGSSVIVDPTTHPKIVNSEVEIFPYVIFKEGLDSWDIGIHRYKDMKRLTDENMGELLARYEQNLKSQ